MTATLTPEQQAGLRAAARRELAQRSLHEFVRQAWHVLEPHTEFIDGPHIEIVCRWLQDITEGKRKRVVINIPPGMSKTMIVSVMWPCWEWATRPHLRYNFFSYAQELAKDASRLRRKLLMSDWYRARWPGVGIADDNNQALQFSSTTSPGMMTAGSVGGIATGRGGERLVIDDPMNPRMAWSDLEREGAERWFRQTLPSRLRVESGGVVLVMQRLHERDTSALALEFGFEHLCLPWLYEPDHPNVSPEDWRTEPDEPLAPERFSDSYMDTMRHTMGTYAWAGQYQQRPAPAEGMVFKPNQFKRYTRKGETLTGEGRTFIPARMTRFNTADFAYSTTDTSDFTVVMAWAGDPVSGDLMLLDVYRERIDIMLDNAGAHKHHIRQMRERHDASYTLVEAKALASRVIEMMQREGEPVRGINKPPGESKLAAAMAALPWIELGRVWLPQDAPWIDRLMHELVHFRGAKSDTDDQIDCLTYAVNHWRQRQLNSGAPVEAGVALSQEEYGEDDDYGWS
jgi:predicted phage terminase large subunit-like protein